MPSLTHRALLVLALLLATTGAGANWPQFGGDDGNGVAAGANLPLTWGEGRNVRWKTRIHGRGWSSPVVLDGQVWVTRATEDGRRLAALALYSTSGRIIHDPELFRVESPQYVHPFDRYASPTPVIGAGRTYKVLAENQLDEGFMASPAADGWTLILRTRTHVYAVAE